jgi:cytochrome c-type biogenesis protein
MELGLVSVFAAGLATLLTPCVLPMLPVYLTLLLGAGLDSARTGRERWRLVLVAAFFVAGFSLVFTLLGMAASGIGGLLEHHREELLVAGGVLIALFGLKYLGVLRIGLLDRTAQLEGSQRATGIVRAFLFGIVFALGWTPCVGPILGSVLTYTAATTSSPLVGALYLFIYSLGVGLPLLGLSVAADRIVPLLKKVNRHLPVFEKITGAAMILVSVGLIYPTVVRPAAPAGEGSSGAVDTRGITITPAIGEPADRPRLVEFFSEHCPVCQRMKPRLSQLREDCFGHRIEIIEVNVDDPRNQALAKAHSVGAVPTIRLFNAAGSMNAQLYGERTLTDLRVAAASLVEATCQGEIGSRGFDDPGNVPSCSVSTTERTTPNAAETAAKPVVECQDPGPRKEGI